ncbi:MAG: hypothetical protein EOO47_15650 [Flavobacterium sp.]|nr:MAG: hypothetical protein EOO47_15650 [Flavobacterium sp.]
MDKENLSIFATIKGIGSASGLFLKQNFLYVIGDNSAYLYEYDIYSKIINKIQLLKDLPFSENIAKAVKPDFEVLCHYENSLYILGSGSTANRNLMLKFDLQTKQVSQHDLSSLYAKIKQQCKIDDENLNIEGAVFNGNNWYLFNRGNGNAQKNGMVKVGGSDLSSADDISFVPIILLKDNKKLVSFTDALLHNKEIYFIAAAEDTKSTYEDGKILGSYIGSINAETLELKFTKKISSTHKFEGITLFKQQEKQIEFLLCEDRDTDVLETVIYKVII